MSVERNQSVVVLGMSAALLLAALMGLGLLFKKAPSIPLVSFTDTRFHFASETQAWYRNEIPSFSFRVPAGFSVPNQAIAHGNGEEVVLVDADQNMLLILAYPILEGSGETLSPTIVSEQSPDEHVSNFAPTTLADGTQALSFTTDSENWDGSGVAVWFIHEGYLYELSTATKNKALLDLILPTFYFPETSPK